MTHRLTPPLNPLMMARVTPLPLQFQVRTLSKVTRKDTWQNRTSKSSRARNKYIGRIADEGRKLADSEFFDEDDHSSRNKSNSEGFLNDLDIHSHVPRSMNRKTVTDDTTPSSLFVKSPEPSQQLVSKKSLYEEHYEFAVDFMNSLLRKNPFEEMKRDPYDLSYPVDNQDGQVAEKGIGFAEHVLLDDLYKDFPKAGPIRNFIELVITGLSQNPYLTPEEKREHVAWFKKEINSLSPDELNKMDMYYEQLKHARAKRSKERRQQRLNKY